MSEAFLSIGSNLGERLANLKKAISALDFVPETKVISISKFYETDPFDTPDKQNNYINCCIKIETELTSEFLLGACFGIESALGRARKYYFAPRIIDVDLLLFENEVRNEKNLILPHPRMHERAFVLVPLRDVCQGLKFKNFNFEKNLKNLDTSSVKKY